MIASSQVEHLDACATFRTFCACFRAICEVFVLLKQCHNDVFETSIKIKIIKYLIIVRKVYKQDDIRLFMIIC